jgi:DNA-binding LacI/PurR family transcriptional regulator
MGATATELLIRIIEGEEIKEKNIYMEMKLSIRESSNR